MDPTTELAEPIAGSQPPEPAAEVATAITTAAEEDEDASWEMVRADSPAIAALSSG
jgi:hypothetical protein